jgi:Cu/Ag efflux pump CusA
MLVVPACFALILLLLYEALGTAREALIIFTGVPLALIGGVFAFLAKECLSPSRPPWASSRCPVSQS